MSVDISIVSKNYDEDIKTGNFKPELWLSSAVEVYLRSIERFLQLMKVTVLAESSQSLCFHHDLSFTYMNRVGVALFSSFQPIFYHKQVSNMMFYRTFLLSIHSRYSHLM
jgi:hypothetical protein